MVALKAILNKMVKRANPWSVLFVIVIKLFVILCCPFKYNIFKYDLKDSKHLANKYILFKCIFPD